MKLNGGSLSLLLLLVAGMGACQSTKKSTEINLTLKRELDSLDVVDQRYRKLFVGGPGMEVKFDSVARATGIPPEQVGPYLSQRMVTQDSLNIKRVGQIIGQYGYPGKTLVGEPTNEVALLVIQHSTRIPRYLKLVEQEAAKGEVPFYLYARMLDRHLMYQNQAQLYGTQGCSYGVLNPRTGQRETVSFIWPIEDAGRVNERRKKAGFDSTVEENSLRLGIPYKPLTLAEALRIKQASEASSR
ncbi:hypothetical protein FY528_04645 [Hymenobacter lutimineralis]|uniref:Uncharacterized protein n=1 Tax=Hymenobacter lutimineralis TaxID=2606448 RepID=A0A5D6V9E4_9BACT|nr:DUF6624 domain-containing protein [Hymenobacter lutimineralis]TYZ12591.1 hypothetical protein FY528_04645 [Hymenobacter lutimineralis]